MLKQEKLERLNGVRDELAKVESFAIKDNREVDAYIFGNMLEDVSRVVESIEKEEG